MSETPLFTAPTGLTATAGDGQVALSWDNPSNSSIDSYRVSSDGGTSYSAISNSDATTTSHTVESLANGTAYSFVVRAVNDSLTGAASVAVSATPLFAAPTNLGFTVGNGQVTLHWDDPENDNISDYQLSIDGGTNYSTISDVIIDTDTKTISHTVTGLTNGIEYTFGVRAVNGAAATVSATPTVTNVAVPLAPTNLQASAGDGQVTLSWDDPSNSSITFYQVSNDGGTSYSRIAGSGASTISHTVTGLTNGTEYNFAVRAENVKGTGAPATATETPLFAQLTGLTATAGGGQVTLSWTNPVNDDISDYQLSIDGGTNYSTIDDVIIDSETKTISHTVTGLTNDTEYTFGVRAVNGAAATVSATPTATNEELPHAPTELTATPGDGQVALSWVGPSNSSITHYQVSSDGGTSFPDIEGSNAATTSHTVTGLTNGTEYSLAVRAENVKGTGAPATATATPMFAAPTGLEAFPNSGQVDLEWDTNDKVTDYMVDTRVTGTDVIYASSPISASSDLKTTATILALTNGTDYTFRVVAVRNSLEISEPSSVSATPVDDEQMELEVSFDAAAYNADEGSGPVEVKVTLSPPAAEPLEIPITVTRQGRTVPADYAVEGLVDGKLAFEVGDATQSFTIKATEQAEQDANFHDVRAALGFGTLPANVTKGAPSAATLTIIDAGGVVVRARFWRLNDEILSKHALILADGTHRALGERMDDPCGEQAAACLYTLTNPSNIGTGLQTFTAPGGARLNRNTQYFVHMTFDGSGTRPRWNLTANDNEDSGKAIGWSIGYHRYTRPSGGTGSWEGGGGVYSTSIQIRVQGNTLAPAAPNLSAAPGETQVALTWDDPANNTITKYQYRWKQATAPTATGPTSTAVMRAPTATP